jgi:hypothetical protein
VKPIRALVVSTSYPRQADDWRGRFIADLIAALRRERAAVGAARPSADGSDGGNDERGA